MKVSVKGEMASSRGTWSSWNEFFFSVLGTMVGLGNVWRFPYICFRSGGAAFLIPYVFSVFVCGIPAVLLQLSYCQYSSLGPGKVWVVCPLFKGIGHGMVVVSVIVSVYYNVIVSWTLFYMVGSFSAFLPWSTCDNEWNTELCQVGADLSNSSLQSAVNWTTASVNQSLSLRNNTVMATDEYWRLNVLQISSGIDEPGRIQWQLLLCLLGAWLAVFLSLVKGINSFGKIMYVTATLPYVILIALLIRGCLLPGALDGIKYYMIPQWEKLLNPTVWRNAASQVFYSLSISSGCITTLASYNRFHNNCYRDAIVLPILDCLTSWFAGLVVFVYLGYISNQSNVHITEVVTEGPELAFIAYPYAMMTMPLPQLWSVLFFLMLFSVGLDSEMVMIQTVVCALTDIYPKSLGHRKLLVTATVCIIGFVLGISCVTQGGIYFLTLVDWYLGALSLLVLVGSEMIVLAWLYGVNRLYKDIEIMIGYRISVFWKPMWLVISALIIMILIVAGLLAFEPPEHDGGKYPTWAQVIGWFIAMAPLLPIPIGMITTILKEEGNSFRIKLTRATKPTKAWHPATNEVGDHYDEDEGNAEEELSLR